MNNLLPNNLYTEALIMGVVLVVVGKLVSYAMSQMLPSTIGEEYHEAKNILNRHYIMEICLFITGLLSHLILEYIGVNNWYCKYGAACLAN